MHRVEPGKHIQFQAISETSSSAGCSFDIVILPVACKDVTTRYFRVHSGVQVTHHEKRFASIAWEVFNILKENFPSKVLLFQENLDLCRPEYLPLSSSEEIRRQISCIMSLKEDNRSLTLDELEDLWYTLSFAEKLADYKSMSVCLDLLNHQLNQRLQGGRIELSSLFIDEQLLTRIIAKHSQQEGANNYLQSNRNLAQDIITNFQMSLRQVDEGVGNSLVTSESSHQMDTHVTLTQQFQGLAKQEKQSTRMCLF